MSRDINCKLGKFKMAMAAVAIRTFSRLVFVYFVVSKHCIYVSCAVSDIFSVK